MKSKIITFWAPVKRQGGCSTNVALYASYLSQTMDEIEKAVIFSLNENADAADYLTPNSIRNGSKDLLFLSETNNISSKEDILAYTHKVSENLDILGTGKDREAIAKRPIKIIEILSAAYDYILIDSITEEDLAFINIIGLSDLIVVCVPQDRFVYERLDMGMFENKKVIFLSSMHNEKNELSINRIQAMVPVQVYPIGRYDKVNLAVFNQEVYSYVGNEHKKKSTIITELESLHNEVHRLINIENLNITYELKKNKKISNVESTSKPEIKVIKEYKFIKAKNNVAVINLSQGAGSTFITLNLAYWLKDKNIDVSVIEIPHNKMNADIYNIVSDADDSYISVSEMINSNSYYFKEKNTFVKNNIKFYINNKMIDKWNLKNNMDYLNIVSKESTINLYDIGSQAIDENIDFLLNIIDVVIVIIDPMPYKILQSEERMYSIQKFKEKNINIEYVLNKYIKDLNKRDIEKYFNIKFTSLVPFIKPEAVYAAYYSNQAVYNFEGDEMFKDSLSRIINQANIIDYDSKKENKKFKLFKWM